MWKMKDLCWFQAVLLEESVVKVSDVDSVCGDSCSRVRSRAELLGVWFFFE